MTFPTSLGWARIIGYVVLGFVALYAIRSFGGGPNPLNTWLASGKVEVQTNRTVLARHDAYVKHSAAVRKRLADSLTSVRATVESLASLANGLAARARTAEQMQQANIVLAHANAVCLDGLALCRTRSDSLARSDSIHTDSLRTALLRADTTLARGLQVAQCHILLLLPCLSRTQSLEVGLLGGLALGVVLTHR